MSDKKKTSRIDVIGQNGPTGEHYTENQDARAAAYIRRQTARGILVEVARSLQLRVKAAESKEDAAWLICHVKKIRAALDLLLGD